MPNQKVAFVTGATGFLGSHLCEQLVKEGWKVLALHRRTADTTFLKALGPAVELVHGDVTDLDSLLNALPQKTDAVFHVAADVSLWKGNDDRQYKINVIGTRNVVEACLQREVKRMLHTSTTGTYLQKDSARLITEDMQKKGGESWVGYNRTKFQAEEEVLKGIQRGLDAVILNPAHIVGRYDRHSWATLFKLVVEDKLPAVPPGSGSFANAEQVAIAHIRAFEKGRTGENYILAGPYHTTLEFVEEIAKLAGKTRVPPVLPYPILMAYGYLSTFCSWFTGAEPDMTPEKVFVTSAQGGADSSKAVSELGYRADITMAASCKECYDWLVQAHEIPAAH